MSAPPRHPITADQIRPGDPYELSEGRLVECLPTGRRGGRSNLVGGAALGFDPAVEAAAVDLGVSPKPNMLRAPDLAVGAIPDEPGWATTAPPLAVEYADTGQDEAELQRKIEELLTAGTRWLWVVRLTGVRRVEVYDATSLSAGRAAPPPGTQTRRPRTRGPAPSLPPARVAYPGETLLAPGVLKNPVLVEALYDREAAQEATLRNLLQRKGYEDLDAVRNKGLTQGHQQGLRAAVRDLCEVLDVALSPEREASLEAMNEPEIVALRDHLKRERRWP